MRYKFFIFSGFAALSFAIFSCNGGSSSSQNPDLAGFEVSNYSGNIQKATKKDSTSSFVVEDGYVQNGKKVGSWIVYYPSGMPKKLLTYVDGNLVGVFLEYNDKGQLDARGFYKDGKLNGSVLKFRYAQVMEDMPYSDGKLNGMYKKFYLNSKIQTIAYYKNGVQDGKYQFFTEEGTMTMDYDYKNGEKVGGGPVSVPNAAPKFN